MFSQKYKPSEGKTHIADKTAIKITNFRGCPIQPINPPKYLLPAVAGMLKGSYVVIKKHAKSLQ